MKDVDNVSTMHNSYIRCCHNFIMSSSAPPGPDSTSTSRSLRCEQCGITFSTTEGLAQHNRQEHGMK
jgi:hypothetical protein